MSATALDANKVIEERLDNHLSKIETETEGDALAFCGPMYDGMEDFVRDAVEKRKSEASKDKISVVLETGGGSIDVAQRVADTLRHHYTVVDFIVPNYAMSAGTVLVMSGDSIWMDYYSVLGPIDPQVRNKDGRWVPALGYLHKYKQLMDKSKKKNGLTEAEVAYLISRFDPGDLYSYEQARDLSEKLLKQWLAKYKFKDWKTTQTTKKPVTEQMKIERAKEINDTLNNTALWSSHSRPISMEVLRRDVNLKIEDFGKKKELNEAIRSYHQLLRDYMGKTRKMWAIHIPKFFKGIEGG